MVLSTDSLVFEGACDAPAQSVTVSNEGVSSITFTAESGAPVYVSPQSSTLSPGASVTLQVAPFPAPILAGNGSYSGTIRLAQDVSIAVQYRVVGFRATLPENIDFGDVPLGTSAQRSISAIATQPSTPLSLTANDRDFRVFGAGSPPNSTRPPWTVTFAPTTIGPRSTVVNVQTVNGLAPVCPPNAITVTGVGVQPNCDPTTNLCGSTPSCTGLAATCGPNGNVSCCDSTVVGGGTFNRGNDPKYPATVSSFRLDTYEVTVGRFKNFVAAYVPPTAGSGRNPNNPNDPGWDASWNTGSLADATALAAAVQCSVDYQTYTAGNDNLPMNCLNWFEAQAFCIWDGGRLPTEAEWNYASAGGAQQRTYPWGSAEPGADANLAVYGCYYPDGSGSCTGVENIAAVGSILAGNGLFGQADLSGNVWEWVQDWSTESYPNPCINCASTSADPSNPDRVVRGGGFRRTSTLPELSSSNHASAPPSLHEGVIGARCARSPAG